MGAHSKFFDNAEHSDVTLTLRSGRIINAHKVILVASAYFYDCDRAAPGSPNWDLSECHISESGIIAAVKHLYGYSYDFHVGWHCDFSVDPPSSLNEANKSNIHCHVSAYMAAEFFMLPALATEIIDGSGGIIWSNLHTIGFFENLDQLFSAKYKDNKFVNAVFDHVVKDAAILFESDDFVTDALKASPFLVRTLKHLAEQSSSEAEAEVEAEVKAEVKAKSWGWDTAATVPDAWRP